MAFINIANLTFAYEGASDPVFENVSFRMDTDWRLGFTGRNGRGKTTFLRLLLDGNQEPGKRKYEYSGTISAGVEFEYFPYRVEEPERLSLEIAETFLPGIGEPGEIWRLFRELALLEVEAEVLYRPFVTLSHGEQTKLLLALLFLKNNRFLLIDEPTNHLDMQARELLGGYLKKKSGFILVSHDRRLLDSCVDHVLAINRTNIEIQRGNFSSWWENKRRQDEFELAENERLKKDIGRLKAAARQSRDWADQVEATKIGHKNAVKFATVKNIDTRAYIGEKSRRMQMRRKNLERRQEQAINEKSSLLKNLEKAEQLKLFPLAYRAERLALFDGVSIAYGERQVVSGLDFEICRGDRIALCGRNGCGKSSVLKALLGWQGQEKSGTEISLGGTLSLGSQLTISYVPQDTSALRGLLSDSADRQAVDYRSLVTLLRKLDFSREQLEKRLEDYSEGQKKKVLLAASLTARAHLYIWDEPLNYIDVLSRMQIEELILTYCPTLLFVEHDREFVERVATKTVQLP